VVLAGMYLFCGPLHPLGTLFDGGRIRLREERARGVGPGSPRPDQWEKVLGPKQQTPSPANNSLGRSEPRYPALPDGPVFIVRLAPFKHLPPPQESQAQQAGTQKQQAARERHLRG